MSDASIREELGALAGGLGASLREMGCWIGRNRCDLLVAALLGLGCAVGCFLLALRIHPAYIDPERDAWVWFEADLIRVFQSMISRGADNYRTNVHPISALLMYVPTKTLMIAGMGERLASIAVLSSYAGLWAGCMYGAFRGIGLWRADAILMSVLAASTSSAIFWFPVQEVYGIAGLSMAIACALATRQFRNRLGPIVQAIIGAVTLSVTTTNFALGILLALGANPLRRALRVLFDALLIITILFAIQQMILPRSAFFVPKIGAELNYLFHENAGGILERVRAFFLYGAAIPTVPFLENPKFPDWFRLSVQFQPLSSLGLAGGAGAILWVAMLAWGGIRAVRDPVLGRLAIALALFILFQLALHLVYGDEMFLYTLNFVPLMVVLAAFALLGERRALARVGFVALAGCLLYNNLSEYIAVTDRMWAHAEALAAG